MGSIFLQELEDFLDFRFGIFGIPGIEGILDTVLEVGFKDPKLDLFKGALDSPKLGNDIHAVASFLDHLLETSHLPLDLPQTVYLRIVARVIHVLGKELVG